MPPTNRPEPAAPLAIPQPDEVVAPALYESRFWIVSSRECPQGPNSFGGCPLDYYSVDCLPGEAGCRPGGRVVQRTSGEMLAANLVPGVPVCIVVHGSWVNWSDVENYGCRVRHWLRSAEPEMPLQLIYYTWPSERITLLPQVDVNVLGRRSAINAFYLSSLLYQVPVESPVSLLGHSHGTRTIAALLHLLGGGEVEGYALSAGSDRGHRLRAVLAASAIDHDWFNPRQRYDRALCRVEGLLSLHNNKDVALRLYPLRRPFSSRALSQSGLTKSDQRRLGALAEKICELDVSDSIGHSHAWPTYYSRPEIAAAISPYIFYSDIFSSDAADPLPMAVPVEVIAPRFP